MGVSPHEENSLSLSHPLHSTLVVCITYNNNNNNNNITLEYVIIYELLVCILRAYDVASMDSKYYSTLASSSMDTSLKTLVLCIIRSYELVLVVLLASSSMNRNYGGYKGIPTAIYA